MTETVRGVPCKSCGVLVYKQTRNDRLNETGLCRACWQKSKRGVNSNLFKRGYWICTQGYKLIRIYPEDFFYPMADNNGYVREHRLVMAKHLGRNLHSWESVHHKDGNKLNNILSNLELTTKNQHMRDHNNGYRDGFGKGLVDGRKEALKKVVDESETDFIFLKELIANNENDRAIAYMIQRWQSLLRECNEEN